MWLDKAINIKYEEWMIYFQIRTENKKKLKKRPWFDEAIYRQTVSRSELVRGACNEKQFMELFH